MGQCDPNFSVELKRLHHSEIVIQHLAFKKFHLQAGNSSYNCLCESSIVLQSVTTLCFCVHPQT